MPREDPKIPGEFAVVGWGHGVSGIVGECASSHIRNLWYQYSGPYILALQGYVVVAPDYAGLGVARHADGRPIRHTWLSSAQGNDMIYAVKAAQEAFPELSERFVLVGHSQGRNAVWTAARRLEYVPFAGYLGTIAASPSANISDTLKLQPLGATTTAFGTITGIGEIFPTFQPSEWLTDKGIRYLNLIKDPGLIKTEYTSSPRLRNYANLMANSGCLFTGPMLVLQGTPDSVLRIETVDIAVNKTCENYPDSKLEYATFKGVDHVPIMYASQGMWLDWIADRFAGREISPPCTRREYSPARSEESYHKNLGHYLEYATQIYLVA